VKTLKKTDEFDSWLAALRDSRAKAQIFKRLARIELGNLGDHKAIGDGVSELRIDYGPGYRLYYTNQKGYIVFLLIGGEKSSQARDIIRAKQLAKEYEG